MSEIFGVGSTKNIRKKFLEQFPKKCETCPNVVLDVIRTATSLQQGRISEEKANEFIAEKASDIEKNCRIGQIVVEGCFGGTDCNYGIIKN